MPTAGAVAAALEAFDGVRRMTLPMKDSPAAQAIDVGRIKDGDRAPMALTPPLLIGPDRLGRSVAVANGLVVATAPTDAIRLPCPQGEIASGAVCAHTHLYSGLARYGMPPAAPAPETFLQILERVWWRLDRALDADTLARLGAGLCGARLLAGTTTLVDHHESPNMIEGSLEILAEVCEQLGVRALLCYGASERNFGAAEGRRGLAECRRVPSSPLLRGLVGLHASFTVSDDTIRAAGRLAAGARHRGPRPRGRGRGRCRRCGGPRLSRASGAAGTPRRPAARLDPGPWRAPEW